MDNGAIYKIRPNLMIGFHGCDVKVRDRLVIDPDCIKVSHSSYDWLGHGFYVWENNYERALQWAKDKKKRNKNGDFIPAVVGVAYTLGRCLDFSDYEYTREIGQYFELLKNNLEVLEQPIPKNKNVSRDEFQDLLLRELDCAVIEFMHSKIKEKILNTEEKKYRQLEQFDSTRGIFTEGGPAYEGAGIQLKSHIQICIRNLNCIKGFFIPRHEVDFRS